MATTRWISAVEAARRFKKSRTTIMRIAAEQKMPMRQATGKRTRKTNYVDADKLEAYMRAKLIDRATMAAKYYTVSQCAEYLNVPRHMIDLWAQKGKIVRKKVHCPFSGQPIVVIRKAEAERFRAEFLARSRYRSIAATAAMAMRANTRDSEVEIEMPEERIERRKYAVRLLTTRTLIDGSPNPYRSETLSDQEVDDMERQIVAGLVTVSLDQLPIRWRSGESYGEPQHYVYASVGPDRTFVRVASG
jgi:hypothetical protein